MNIKISILFVKDIIQSSNYCNLRLKLKLKFFKLSNFIYLLFFKIDLSNWAILHLPRDFNTAQSFFKTLSMCCTPLGMNINVPTLTKVRGQNIESYINAINNIILQHKELQLLVIIFPSTREDWYNAVKRICCAKIGIPSQVIETYYN